MSLNSSRYLLLVLFALAGHWSLHAQIFLTNHFRSADGLETDNVKCISQDQLGFVWIGTDDGLFRYDGMKFSRYPSAAPTKFFKSFLTTSDGRLLSIHDMGITEIIPSVDSVKFKTFISGQRLISDSTLWYPKDMYEDKYGNFWITEPQSIIKYSKGNWVRFPFGPNCNSTSFVRSFNFTQINDEELLIISNTGHFFIYKYATGEIQEREIKGTIPVIFKIFQFNSTILLGTQEGLYELFWSEYPVLKPIMGDGITSDPIRDMVQLSPSRFITCSINNSTSVVTFQNGQFTANSIVNDNLFVNKVFLSADNTIWLSTEKGVLVYKIPVFSQLKLDDINNYIEGMMTRPQDSFIYALTKNNVWLINKKSLAQDKIERKGTEDYFLSGAFSGENFIASSAFKLFKIKGNKIIDSLDLSSYGRYIFNLFGDTQGNIWIGQEAYIGLMKLDPETMSITHYDHSSGISGEVTGITQSENGIWAMTSDPDHFLYFKEHGKDQFIDQSASFPEPFRQGLSMESITFCNGHIWIGTNFGVFQLRDGKIEKFHISNGMDNSAVRMLKSDGDYIWIGSTIGLIRYNTITDDYAHFSEGSGLPVNTVNTESLIIEYDKVWAGTSQGIAYASRNHTSTLEKSEVPVILSFTSNGVLQKMDEDIELEYNPYIEINFSSLTFPSKDLQYSYNIDGNWSAPQSSQTTILSKLKEGHYTFLVRAKRLGNYSWSDPQVIQFKIKPPFYKGIDFYLLVIFVLGLAIFLTRQFTKNREKRRQAILKTLVSERTKELNDIKERLEELVKNRTAELEETLAKLTDTQNYLVQTEKMASLGVLTAGIAHEINNPMNYLKGGLYSLEKLLKEINMMRDDKIDHEELSEVMNLMQLGVDRITHIVNGLGRYSRKHDQNTYPCNVHDIINNSIVILEHELKTKVELKMHLNAENYTVFGDEGALHQLFVNLLSNAIQSIPDFGNIWIKTHNINNHQLQVVVTDSGTGIPKESLDKIYDPFFTTKAPGEGTGLGLFITKKIVNEHNATIHFESELGMGTSVFINFNLHEA